MNDLSFIVSRMMPFKGHVHSYESFGAADGPGVRFIVFLSGCPFRCRYCHNPDTWARPASFEATADEVLAKAMRYRSYWGAQGGITVSGGEPMMQPEFVAELFEKAHEKGVTTCLDTAAGCFRRAPEGAACERLLELTDTVLLDIKHIDPVAHRNLTGCDNAPVLDCARFLAERNIPVWIRHVLVPGLTDDPDALARLGDFIRSLGNVKCVDVLPYHTLGVGKWKALNIPYTLEGVEPPTEASLARAREILPHVGR